MIIQNRAIPFFTTGRICADIFIGASIFFLTPWVTLVCVVAGGFYFKNFYETIAVGILIDMLYGIPLEKFFHFQWTMTVLFLIVYFTISYLRPYTRFHEPA